MEPTSYKVPAESYIKNALKKKTWQYGEQLLEKFLKIYEIVFTMEAIMPEKEGVMGHEFAPEMRKNMNRSRKEHGLATCKDLRKPGQIETL
ncbi:hypothetical protein BpHYR1_054119 [Brachionus plicatilis]|uniref:Uncharacterized protein n=1 Tax=Brachionus plicatilis TaxID=10195 RepID=A0A3M7SMR6_BRAPC|nr:hypothetical protein BpHYR1_054119 [Brachionus plicatilis]